MGIITNALTLRMIGDFNCIDNSDAIRLNMLAMEFENKNSLEEIKKSLGYSVTQFNFNIDDNYINDLLKQKQDILSI